MSRSKSAGSKGTSQVSQRSGLYPHVRVDTAAVPAVAHAGGALLTKTARVAGIDRYLSNALRPWRKPLARHDPAKVLLDVAVSLALGGDACRDTALLRAESGVYGPVASDATISRTIAALAGDVAQVEKAIAAARATARAPPVAAASPTRCAPAWTAWPTAAGAGASAAAMAVATAAARAAPVVAAASAADALMQGRLRAAG